MYSLLLGKTIIHSLIFHSLFILFRVVGGGCLKQLPCNSIIDVSICNDKTFIFLTKNSALQYVPLAREAKPDQSH